MPGCVKCQKRGDVMCVIIEETLVLTLAKNGLLTIHAPKLMAHAVASINAELVRFVEAMGDAQHRLSLYSFLAGALAQSVETAPPQVPVARA